MLNIAHGKELSLIVTSILNWFHRLVNHTPEKLRNLADVSISVGGPCCGFHMDDQVFKESHFNRVLNAINSKNP